MIWFGNLVGFPAAPSLGRPLGTPSTRMQKALEEVAARAPQLTGRALITALAETGWVDEDTAERLLPQFQHFDPDRFFAEHLRRISFRGNSVASEFRAGVARALEDITGQAHMGEIGPEQGIRFTDGMREGVILAYPEVGFSLGKSVCNAVAAAVEEMPDALVMVARNFRDSTADELRSLLHHSEVPGTLVTVNLLLGMRAVALRYRPTTERIMAVLGSGRPLRSVDIAALGNRA